VIVNLYRQHGDRTALDSCDGAGYVGIPPDTAVEEREWSLSSGSWRGSSSALEMQQSPLRWAILLATTAVAIYLCALVLRPFFDVIAWSAVLVITFYPVHRRLLSRIRRRSLSAFLSTVFVALTILVPILLVTALVVNELIDLKNLLQERLKHGANIGGIAPIREMMEWLNQRWGLEIGKLLQTISQHAREITQVVAKYSLAFAGNVTNLIVSLVFTIFTMFFLFRDGEQVVARIPDLFPFERLQSELLIRRTRDVIDGSIYGVLVIALIQGALGALAFVVLSVPTPVLWGLLMAVTSLIPMLGAASVWVPATIYLLIIGSWGKAITLAGFGALVISSVDNFLRPKLVGERVRLNELVMFFSVLGGLQVFGVLGIILGPVLFAVTGALIEALKHIELAPRSTPRGIDKRD
jgi:predicted PurR-regulated permease PerM